MPDQSASWLDARLSADDTWTELSDRSRDVIVDDAALAAVQVSGTDATTPAVEVVTDDATWLASTTIAGSAGLGPDDEVVLVTADLRNAAPDDLDDGLGAAFDAGLDVQRDADSARDEPTDLDADGGSGIVDPFDVMLAETTAPLADAVADDRASVVEPLDEDPVATVTEPAGPLTPDASTDSSDQHADERPTDSVDQGGAPDAVAPAPDSIAITPPSRLDAFDVLDASPTADAGHESDTPIHEDAQPDLPDEPFDTDYE